MEMEAAGRPEKFEEVDFSNSGFEFKPGHSLGYLLRDTSRMFLRSLSEKIEAHGITLGQYFLLRELWEEQGITQRELSARVKILEPSLVAALDTLERNDLVTRVRSKQDRRKVHVYLTGKGRALREPLLHYAIDVNRDALRGISRDEIAIIRKLLVRVRANLSPEAEKA